MQTFTLEQVNDIIIDEALKMSNGNLTPAARLLDISPAAMSRRMKRKKSDSPVTTPIAKCNALHFAMCRIIPYNINN